MSDSSYSFNQQDYEFTIKLFNSVNNVELKPEGWDNLYIEEDIFDWWSKGSIEIFSPYESLERGSEEISLVAPDKNKAIYKFRNDGRDTIFISIMPKQTDIGLISSGEFKEERWRIELEAVIYNVEDYLHKNMSMKIKKLYFHEKTFQMMQEKNIEFTTANVGENKSKTDIHKLNNDERSLKTGEALGELLKSDDDFKKHAELVDNATFWNKGDPLNKIMFTSSSNSRFIEDLNYILQRHTAGEADKFQPCILKLERKGKDKPKQFSLLPFKKYFEKAGKGSPGEYQLEHIFLEEGDHSNSNNPIIVQKAPLSKDSSVSGELKASDFTQTSNYQLVDLSGLSHSVNLNNRVIVSFNNKKGQFNIESKEHMSEKFKDFYKESVVPGVLTNQEEDRLPLTRYIKSGHNVDYEYSVLTNDKSRLVEGRNKMIQNYVYTNLGINLSLRGLSFRQCGRFFGLSKQSENTQEYDGKLEGSWLITNLIHHFSPKDRSYSNNISAVKTHVYEDRNPVKDGEDALVQS